MDTDTKALLEESIELSRENNKILKKMQRTLFWGRVFKIAYWMVIIGSMVGAYYFLQPFFDKIIALYNGVIKTFNGSSVINSIPDIGDLLNI